MWKCQFKIQEVGKAKDILGVCVESLKKKISPSEGQYIDGENPPSIETLIASASWKTTGSTRKR